MDFSATPCPALSPVLNYNFSDYDYPLSPRSFTWKEYIKVLAYVFVFLLALLGNVLVILIVYFNQHMRSTTNFYLVNLAVADVMIAVCCMWVHLLKNVSNNVIMLGAIMCKVDPFIQMTSLTASVLTLTAIACDRFIAVIFPLRARLTQQRARVVIVLVWVLAIGASSPFLYYRRSYEIPWKDFPEMQCIEDWDASREWDSDRERCVTSYPGKEFYYTFFVVALFIIPVSVMTITYSLIVWRLWVSQLPGERSDAAVHTQSRAKKKVVKMVLIVLLVFLLCWTPLQIIVLYTTFGHDQHDGDLPSWFGDVEYAAYFIAYSNSAANPVIYCGFNANFRQGLFGILRCSLIQDFRVRTTQTYRYAGTTTYVQFLQNRLSVVRLKSGVVHLAGSTKTVRVHQVPTGGKSSTLTTHIGSGKLRDTPTGITAAPHELVEFNPPIIVVQKPECTYIVASSEMVDGYKNRRRLGSGECGELIVKNNSTQFGNYI